ncbi:hypothetical protein TNCV_4544361 [Trichonephila clavipes]|nr:hypothetical protein TNCV_4544361 [Trichonephila clavipes]
MLNRRTNQQPGHCRCNRDAGDYRKKDMLDHGRATDFFDGVPTYATTELSSCVDYNFFVCAVHLREGRSDGRSPVPKVTIAVFIFALFTGNGFLWNVLSCPTSVNELFSKGCLRSHACKVH